SSSGSVSLISQGRSSSWARVARDAQTTTWSKPNAAGVVARKTSFRWVTPPPALMLGASMPRIIAAYPSGGFDLHQIPWMRDDVRGQYSVVALLVVERGSIVQREVLTIWVVPYKPARIRQHAHERRRMLVPSHYSSARRYVP